MTGPVSTDRFTASDQVGIFYRVWAGNPRGTPVVLHHGFLSDGSLNWETTGVVEALAEVAGPIVVLDARGHGRSEKPTVPDAYGEGRMASDLAELCTRLDLHEFDLVGYSMGGVVALLVARTDRRVRRLVIGGLGASIVKGGFEGLASRGTDVAEALEADDPETISDPLARSFRDFADAVQADRRALAAHVRSAREGSLDLSTIAVPTLVLAGSEDLLARDPGALAAAIPGASLEIVPGDHLRAVGSPRFREALVTFLTADSTPPQVRGSHR